MDAPDAAPAVPPLRRKGDAAASARDLWFQPVATALLLLLVWAAFLELNAHERREALRASVERDANLALALEQYVVRVLRNAEAVNQFVGTSYERGSRGPELGRLLRERLEANDAFTEVLLLHPDGRLLASSAEASNLPQDRVPLSTTSNGPAGAVGTPFVTADGRRLVPLLRRLRPAAGAPGGWSGVLVESSRFLGMLERVTSPADTLVVLARDDGAPLATWGSRGPPRPLQPLDATTLAQLAGQPTGRATGRLDGQPRLLAVREFTGYPLRALVGSLRDDALAEHRTRRNRYLWGCVAFTGLALALSAAMLRIQRRRARTMRRLAEARTRLAALNASLERQVAARTAQLEQANRDLESFSYSVAHDLRAPLAAIEGFSRQLEPAITATGDARVQHWLRRIQDNGARMGQITEGLLMLARLGRTPFAPATVDLTALAGEVLAGLRDAEPGRNVTAVVAPGLVAAGDPVLLRQVLENLLGNAWKFTGRTPGARIEFAALPAPREDEAHFVVRDNGAGFDMAHAGALFGTFQRLHDRGDFPGTGIGLALVQRILVLHGGRIWAEGRPGAGADFFFTLPRAAAAR